VGFLDPVGCAVLDAPRLSASVTTGPTYIWGAMFPESSRTEVFRGLAGPALRDQLLTRFRQQGWGEKPLEVIGRTDPGSVGVFRFHAAATRPQQLAPWPAGPITARATPFTRPHRPPAWERERPSAMPTACSSSWWRCETVA
jgi:salicylate hydroxylase